MTTEQRAAIGIADGLVRLSVGIEETVDIIADIEQALSASPLHARGFWSIARMASAAAEASRAVVGASSLTWPPRGARGDVEEESARGAGDCLAAEDSRARAREDELLLGSRHADVEEAALLLDVGRGFARGRRHAVGRARVEGSRVGQVPSSHPTRNTASNSRPLLPCSVDSVTTSAECRSPSRCPS